MTANDDDQAVEESVVAVPIAAPAGPFDAPPTAEVPVEAAAHWDRRLWHRWH